MAGINDLKVIWESLAFGGENMIKMGELQIIAETDVVLAFQEVRKEGVLRYAASDHIQTPLGRIGISFNVIRLREILGSGYDLDIWYPNLYVDGCLPDPLNTAKDTEYKAVFVVDSYPEPRKSIIYYAEESTDTYSKLRYEWVWMVPLRYYDENSDRYVKDSHIAVLVADLRFGLPEYNNRSVPVLHVKLYEPVPIVLLRDTDS
jgi:hypothetical protein